MKINPLLHWLLKKYCEIYMLDSQLIDVELDFWENKHILEKYAMCEIRLGKHHPKFKKLIKK